MKTEVFMNLQEHEDFAEADCGCILQRSELGGVEAELIVCPLHDAAEVLLDAAKVAADQLFLAGLWLHPKTTKPHPDYLILRAAISKAGGAKPKERVEEIPLDGFRIEGEPRYPQCGECANDAGFAVYLVADKQDRPDFYCMQCLHAD